MSERGTEQPVVEECHCPCHEPERRIMHCIPCCQRCELCGKRIKHGFDEHIAQAHPGQTHPAVVDPKVPLKPLERYLFLKQELIRVRDEHHLHGHSAQNRECRAEDAILDLMDEAWHAMSDEEHEELDGGWESCGGSMNYLAKRIAKWSVSKGWETNWWNVPEKLMLVVTELAEAMEEYRELGDPERRRLEDERKLVVEPGHYPLNYDTVRMEHYPKFRVEIADAVIRLLNLSASLGIDIEAEIAAKMEKNEKRPFKHGGKNC